MAQDPKAPRRPEQNSLRIWPGVTLIAVCAFLVFFGVYLGAFKANLLPLPMYLEALFTGGEAESADGDGIPEDTFAGFAALQAEEEQFFEPNKTSPEDHLAALHIPELYRQRMRFTYTGERNKRTYTADVYVKDNCWKIRIEEDRSRTVRTILCDGERIWWQNTVASEEAVITPVGETTLASVLGIPDLHTLQSLSSPVLRYLDEEKYLSITYPLAEGIQCSCQISLDTGLIMETQLQQNGMGMLLMYTELFDMAPASCSDPDFFRIPEQNESEKET